VLTEPHGSTTISASRGWASPARGNGGNDDSSLAAIWHAPEPVMLAAGADGERLVARVRAIIIALLLVTPTYKFIVSPEYSVYFWGFWVTVFGAVEAAFVLAVLRWFEYRRGWVS
jgi:hypothetical protein